METNEIRIVQAFNNAINERDVNLLSSLMTEEHTFVDASGAVHSGRKEMIHGWKDFLSMFPDYKNNFDSILQDGNLVVALGTAKGTYNGKRGLVPENRIESHRRGLPWQAGADQEQPARAVFKGRAGDT